MTDANPTPMAQMINDSGLAFAGGFPISVQCADTVLSCGAHFDPASSELTNVHGELIAKLDAAAIGAALRILEMENAIVVSRDQAQAMFDQDSDKYKTRVAKSWLKNPKKGASRLTKTLFRADFNEELSDFIILLARVMGFPSTNEFHFWMCPLISMVCKGTQNINWAEIISMNLAEQLSNVQQTKKFYMTSYLMYTLAASRQWFGFSYIDAHKDDPVYAYCPQFTLETSNRNFRRVNDAFTMYVVRLLEGDTARRFSDEAMNLISQYGAYFIQFRKFSYIRLAGYESTPLRLPMFCNDKMALIEICRQLDKLHRTCRDKKISGLHFPISLGNYTCKTALDAQNIERALVPITVHFFKPRTCFDLKKFIEQNIKIVYHHRADTEDYWADCADDFEARRRHCGRFSLQLIQELSLYQVPEGLQDDNSDLYSYEYENVIKHTPLEDLDWNRKERDDLAEILAPVLIRTRVWFSKKIREFKRHSGESSSKDDSTPIREASVPESGTPVKTPPASTTQGPVESTPSPSTQVYRKKLKEVKKEPAENDPPRKQVELPIGPENIIVLSESEESEMPTPANVPEDPTDKDKEVQSTELPGAIDSSTAIASSALLTSQLESTASQTLSVMSSLSLGPLAPPADSSSSFAWVQPLVDKRKRKSSSQSLGPNFDAVAALLGTTPSRAKKARTTSRIVSDAQGQQFLEIAKPTVEKSESDLLTSDLELSRIPMGESTPEGEIHNLQETITRVIGRVEKGQQTIEQLEEQAQVLTSFIKSLLSKDKFLDPTPLTALPPPVILSQDEVQSIKDMHKYSVYGRAIEAMVDDMLVAGLNFIDEAFKLHGKVDNLQQKLSSAIGVMDKELKLWSSCIVDLRLMGQTDENILLANKIFDDAKDNLSKSWVYSVEWKIKVLEEAVGEMKNSWQKGEAFKTLATAAFKDIHCHLQDENSGVSLSLQEIKAQFRAFVKDHLFKESSISKEKMKEICSLQSAIEEANKDYHTHVEFDKEMEKCFGFWNHSAANMSVPRGRDIAESLKKFRQRILKT
ncbi:hypothetical protein KI387_011333, partial [Taxus chinensis]